MLGIFEEQLIQQSALIQNRQLMTEWAKMCKSYKNSC